jgi:hypothetical protein
VVAVRRRCVAADVLVIVLPRWQVFGVGRCSSAGLLRKNRIQPGGNEEQVVEVFGGGTFGRSVVS